MIPRDKIAGALYGVALGDALGRPMEFMKLHDIHRRFGKSGVMQLSRPALFTDDTQMTLAVSTAIWKARTLTPLEMTRTLRQAFIAWEQRDPARAPGVTCLTAIRRMKHSKRMSWVDATVVSSKGCGANMRVAPAAFIRDVPTALGVAQLQAAMTHGHPVALVATELTALAIRWAAMDMPLTSMVDRLLAHTVTQMKIDSYRGDWLGRLSRRWPASARASTDYAYRECANALLDLRSLLRRGDRPKNVCKVLGGGWVAEEALVLGLYFAVTHRDNAPLAISEAARTSGDSDSIASIAGAIIGASLGENAWPLRWRKDIERRQEIEQAIDVAEVSIR